MASTSNTFVYTVNPQYQVLNDSQLATLADNGGGTGASPDADRSIVTQYFPADLFSNPNRASHVMQININENKITSFESALGVTNANSPAGQALSAIGGDISNILTGGSGTSDKSAPITNPLSAFNRVRMKGAIFLFMPNGIQYTNNMQYTDVSLTDLGAELIGKPIEGILGAMGRAGEIVGGALNGVADVAMKAGQLGGLPINPKMEVVFSNITQRVFQFEFLFAPTSAQETNTLYNIIKTLRREAAPKSTDLIFWQAPSSFDISFLHNGQENTALPKIQECFLESIDIDMAPQGVWSTFTNGYPTNVRLQMRFREIWPNDRDQIDKGY